MKIIVEKKYLESALAKAQTIIEKRTTHEMLSNVLIQLDQNQITVIVGSIEVGLRIKLPLISFEGEGSLATSAKRLLEIVRELDDKPVQLVRKNNFWVEISSGRFKTQIVGFPPEQYPKQADGTGFKFFEVNGPTLYEMIDRTAFAVSTDETRYNLNGVYFEPIAQSNSSGTNTVMQMTAIDGTRLAQIQREVFKIQPEMKRGIIIPRKGLAELKHFLEQNTENVEIAFDLQQLYARSGNSFLWLKLIEAEYPDFRPLIPAEGSGKRVTVKKTDLEAALRRVSLVANEKTRGIRMSLSQDTAIFSATNDQIGDAQEEINIKFESGDTFEIGYNSKYFVEGLSVLKSDNIELWVKDKLSPTKIHEEGRRDFTYVIMPMRL